MLFRSLEKGKENGVPDLRILTKEEVLEMEPHISEEVVAALYAPSGGIVCPFNMTIALAENAYENGVAFYFHTKVLFVKKEEERFTIQTSQGDIKATYVVNAAGIYGDQISNGINSTQYEIIPRRGEYCLLDKEAGTYIHHTIFQLPGKYGKGILLTPTVHKNLLVGPTANDIEDKEDIATTSFGIEEVIRKASKSIKNIPFRQTITSFAGLRAHEKNNDFVIREEMAGFINVIGIESPGLTCAPAIGLYVAQLIAEKAGKSKKVNFKAYRKGILNPNTLSKEERRELIQNNPAYGLIVCRCENVSEGEILDAIRRPLGATSLDGIKRRVRQGMGRCQAGFCTPRTIDLLAKELQIPVESVCKNTIGSNLLMEIKEVGDEK